MCNGVSFGRRFYFIISLGVFMRLLVTNTVSNVSTREVKYHCWRWNSTERSQHTVISEGCDGTEIRLNWKSQTEGSKTRTWIVNFEKERSILCAKQRAIMCVCVCVCVCERDRERERQCEWSVLIVREKVADRTSRIQYRFLDNSRTLQRGYKGPLR